MLTSKMANFILLTWLQTNYYVTQTHKISIGEWANLNQLEGKILVNELYVYDYKNWHGRYRY